MIITQEVDEMGFCHFTTILVCMQSSPLFGLQYLKNVAFYCCCDKCFNDSTSGILKHLTMTLRIFKSALNLDYCKVLINIQEVISFIYCWFLI